MNEFPLAPFLAMLATDGIRVTLNDYDRISLTLRTGGTWTVKRLRGVLLALLVKSADQEKAFVRRFDEFFNTALEVEELSAAELEQLWAQLHGLIRERNISLPVPSSAVPRTPLGKAFRPKPQEQQHHFRFPKYRFRSWHVLMLIPVLALTAFLWFKYLQPSASEIPIVDVPDLVEPLPIAPPNQTNRQTTTGVSVSVKEIGPPVQLPVEHSWRDQAGVVGLFSLLTLGYAIFLWVLGNLPTEHKLAWDPRGQRHFPLGQIGGKSAPHLDSVTLDQLADSLGYFQSEAPGKRLNVRASVEAMARQSGLPLLVFHKRRQLRTVYILEDAYAQPLAWNPVPHELAEGLSQRGIHVKYGRFYGSPTQFQIEGTVEWLEDMEAQRQNYLLLVFSDSKSLHYRRDSFVLETLARWPFLAWMELREPRHWDESTALVKNYGLPLFPATSAGLLRAMQRFLTEQSAGEDFSDAAGEWRGIPASVGSDLSIYVEGLLGDALLWGQACAMIQPVTMGLADALRREFQPHLSPERIERLFALPGTSMSASGIRFSVPVLAVLRAGFMVRWDQHRQDEILRFLMEKIAETEPEQKDSLAHLVWQWTMERVRLELEPDRALEQIAKLEETPLKGAIQAELENVVLPGAPLREPGSTDITRVPLRRKPQTQEALAHLARIATNVLKDPEYRPWLIERIRANLRQLARLFNHLRVELDALIWRIVRSLLEGVEKLNGAKSGAAKFDALNASDIGTASALEIVAHPRKLSFKHLKRNRTYSRRLTLRTVSGGWLLGQASADTNWIRVEPAIFDSDKSERFIKVLVDTSGLQPGQHEGNVILVAARHETLVPVTLAVVESWRERVAAWWKKHKPAARLQLPLALAAFVLAVLVTHRILPANWVNRLYNRPPALKEVKETERLNEQDDRLKIKAYAEDPDRDEVVQYKWEADGGEIEGNGDSAIVKVAGIAPAADGAGSEVNLKLKLKDARGGHSAYTAKITLESKTHETETEVTVTPTDPASEAKPSPPVSDPSKGGAAKDKGRQKGDKLASSQSEQRTRTLTVITDSPVSTVRFYSLDRSDMSFRTVVASKTYSFEVSLKTLPPGTYAVAVEENGKPDIYYNLVTIGDSDQRVALTMNEADGPLYEFVTNVKGIEVTIDGSIVTIERGGAQYLVPIAKGQHKIVATKQGYKQWEQTIDISTFPSRIIKIEMVRDSQDLLAKARELYQVGRYDEALREARRALAVDPANAKAYLLLSRISEKSSDFPTAVGYVNKAIELAPNLIDAYILRGHLYLMLGDLARALEDVNKALVLDPNNQEALDLRTLITKAMKP